MAWQWQQSGPVSYNHQQYPFPPAHPDEKHPIPYDAPHISGAHPNGAMSGNAADPAYGYAGYGYGEPSYAAGASSSSQPSSSSSAPGYPYRPSSVQDTNYDMPPAFPTLSSAGASGASSNAGYDTSSLPDAERLITPGLYSYQQYPSANIAAAAPSHVHHQSNAAWQPTHYSSAENYYYSPVSPHMDSFPSMPQAGPSTISPTALGQGLPKATKSFGEIMMNSRASSSSASSTEGGHDWSGGSVFEDWTRPIHRALDAKPSITHQRDLPTIPEPSSAPSRRQYQVGGALDYSSYGVPGSVASEPVPGSSAVDIALAQYIDTPNRLAFGERKIMVMSPKVGQKSYGNEKRFLCPHPQAILVGAAWWRKTPDNCPVSPLLPPRVNISLAGEQPVKDAQASWSSVTGVSLDEKLSNQPITTEDQPFLGTVAGRNLHISDNDGKRREVKALVTVKAPLKIHAGPNGWGPQKGTMVDFGNEEIIGTFESKEIKVISKPSKKKSSTKSGELILTHGSTIAMFNRVKSQTTSTRYLSVVPDYTRILGSDGRPVFGATVPSIPSRSTLFPGFTANAAVWESFIIWLVDPSKSSGPGTSAPIHPEWPSAPANALPSAVLSPPIRYNSTVVLQSLQTGICSPTLVIRRIEQDSDVVGMDGTFLEHTTVSVPEGELLGDLVSQLQKVAFEVYRPEAYLASTNSQGSLWLACEQEATAEKVVKTDKRWAVIPPAKSTSRPNSTPSTPSQRFGVLPMTPHTTTMNLPSTPSSPVSSSSSLDYFGAHSRKSSSSALFSPPSAPELQLPPTSTDGGPIRRQRTGSNGRAGPLTRPGPSPGFGHRKKMSTDNSASSSYEHIQTAAGQGGQESRIFWTLDVGDVCVWSIISTEQVSYTFFIPPYVDDVQEPVAPFPSLTRVLPPNMAADGGLQRYNHEFTSRTNLPLVTLYGKNFQRKPDNGAHHHVYFGKTPAAYNEVRCAEVMAASEPDDMGLTRQAIYLVREDGRLIQPTGLTYPP